MADTFQPDRILEKNSTDNTNIDGACFNHFSTGQIDLITKGRLNECALTFTSNTVSMNTGEIIASGFRNEFDNAITFSFTTFPVETETYSIILEIDVDDNNAPTTNIYLILRSSLTLIQDNIFENGSGTYMVEIAYFDLTSNGILEAPTKLIKTLGGVVYDKLELGETSDTAYAGNKGAANAVAIDALDTRVTTNEGDIAEILDGTQAVGITNALNGDIVNYENLNKTILGNSYNLNTTETPVTSPGFDFTCNATSPVELRFKFDIIVRDVPNHYVVPYIRYRESSSYVDTQLTTIQTSQPLDEPISIDKTITTTLSDILTFKIYFTAGSTALGIDFDVENLEIYADGVLLSTAFVAGDYTTDTSEDISYLATKTWVDENYVKIETMPTYDIASMVLPNFYNVFDDSANPQNLTYSIFIDYMLTNDFNDALFSNGSDHYNIYQNLTQTEDVETETKTLSFSSDSATIADTDINIISTKASVANIDTRILVIGDSVTAGYGAEGEMYHNQLYKRIKEEDVNFSRTTNVEFLGTKNNTYSFTYLANTYSKLICDEGRSGWGIIDYYNENDFATDGNPFYDGDLTTDCKFSINKWIERYRTMDDTGTRLAIGDATLGTEITSANLDTINVATPNIVVINLGHNDFYRYGTSTFFTYYEEILAKIREELPSAYIIVMVTMPLLYCYHKEFYPDYETEDTSTKDTTTYYYRYRENAAYWKDFVSTNTDDKILVLPEFNITPTVNSYRWEIQENYMGENTYKYNHTYGHAHPYIPAHNIWGYQLYAMYKYIMKLEEV